MPLMSCWTKYSMRPLRSSNPWKFLTKRRHSGNVAPLVQWPRRSEGQPIKRSGVPMDRAKAEAAIAAKGRPFTGAEYLESLRDGREVYVYGERVKDVTTHPAF